MMPNDIRVASINERLLYFENIYVAHPHLINTFNALLEIVEQRDSPLVVGVVGASGSGTTLLRFLLEQHIMQQWYQSSNSHSGLLPLVSLSARALGVSFDLNDYRVQLLTALQEPLIDRKVEPGDVRRRRVPSDKALQHALHQSLQHRKPIAVLVDNAQFFLISGSPHDDADLQSNTNPSERSWQAEVDNALADRISRSADDEESHRRNVVQTIHFTAACTGICHILFGSYKVLDVLDGDTQSANLNTFLYLPRYVLAKRQDAETFSSLLMTFQKHMPLEQEPDLVGYSEELYATCLGCVGFLKKQLYRSLADALEKGMPTITIDILRKYAEDPITLACLGREIIEGEKRIEDRIRIPSADDFGTRKSRNNRPFTRKPKRDDVRT